MFLFILNKFIIITNHTFSLIYSYVNHYNEIRNYNLIFKIFTSAIFRWHIVTFNLFCAKLLIDKLIFKIFWFI